MFKILNKKDVDVLKDVDFYKNAEYFADANAFFDAYSKLCDEDEQKLPKYILDDDGKLCLNGACLFILTYCSEFNFETTNLKLDYLKMLYYSISKLSIDKKTVSKDELISEYLVYKQSVKDALTVKQPELDAITNKYMEDKVSFRKKEKYVRKLKSRYTVFLSLAIVILVSSIFASVIPVAFYYLQSLSMKSSMIYASAILLIGITLYVDFRLFYSLTKKSFRENSYELVSYKKKLNTSFSKFKVAEIENCELVCNNYEYNKNLQLNYNFAELDFSQILSSAKKLTKLNNLKLNDRCEFIVNRIDDIIDEISNISIMEVSNFEKIYDEIENDDYLKYNKIIRSCFLNKFYDSACLNNEWQIRFEKQKVYPFGVDLLKYQFEKIAFLPKKEGLFISTNFDKVSQMKKFSELKNIKLNFEDNYKSYSLLKKQYLNHFFDLEKLNDFNNLFYNKKIYDVKISNEILYNYCKLPYLIEQKLSILSQRFEILPISLKDCEKIMKLVNIYESKVNN